MEEKQPVTEKTKRSRTDYVLLVLLGLCILGIVIIFCASRVGATAPVAIPEEYSDVGTYTSGVVDSVVWWLDYITLTPWLQALLGILATLISAKLIPLLKAKLGDDAWRRWERALAIIKMLVEAAEQLNKDTPGQGEIKLQWVMDELSKRGIVMDRAAIEAAVYELTNAGWQYQVQIPHTAFEE